ncbi:MAG TPA: glucose-1-phosphate thymidylyltransferase, partial [Bacteroidia bacterium]|nr:glucose-1-phosphate thymidylyltransferase [Bacteroidia bacterium]
TRFNVDGKDHLTGDFGVKESKVAAEVIHRIADIFTNNGAQIIADLELMKPGSRLIPSSNQFSGSHTIHIMKGAMVESCIFNTSKGPIYIGKDAEVMEGSMLRGPLAICDGAVVKMGAKIYGDTTIGPGCKVGGEITNSVLFGNSNKAHDGYLGNSVIGEWCNLGADTNTSNLKNTYGEVSVYNYAIGGSENTGMQFHGLIMGDHAKCGINTMFNTGTVVGVCANVFGGSFPKKFIPDFSWGGTEGMEEFNFEKAMEMIAAVYNRRQKKLETAEVNVLRQIFDETRKLKAQ